MAPSPLRRPRASTLLATVAALPLAYPLWLAFVTRGRRPPEPPQPATWPDVAAIVPAYREQHVIAGKLDDLRSAGYPGTLRVLVVAEDDATAEAARGAGAEVLSPEGRLGKAEALNRGVAATREPIVVITDANTVLAPGSLEALVRWFADADVGAVAGEKRVSAPEQGFYWIFESWLKRRESTLGSTVAVVGELAAVRRSLYRAIPADVSADDLWIALEVLTQGSAVRYEPDAVAIEEPADSLSDEWRRRTRTVCAVIDTAVRRRSTLASARDAAAVQLLGHRLGRYTGAVAHAAWLLLALRPGRRPLMRLALVAHAGAALALLAGARGAPVPAPARIAAQIVLMQAAGVAGMARYAYGDRPAQWHKPERPPFVTNPARP